jgi:hypothetical protein
MPNGRFLRRMSSGLLQNSKGAPSEVGIGEYFFSPQHEFVQKKHPSILIVDSFVRLLRHDMSWQVDIRSHQLLIGTRLRRHILLKTIAEAFYPCRTSS